MLILKRRKQTEEHIKKRLESCRKNENFGFKKGHKIRLGKHWKVKDTLNYSKARKEDWRKGKRKFKQNTGFQKGHKTNLGRKCAEITKKKIGLANSVSIRGEKSSLWKGGISYEPYSVDWTKTLKRSVRERDHYICQLCNQYGNTVHHIDYNKQNCNLNNLITLCRNCHQKTNFDREYWIECFKKYV